MVVLQALGVTSLLSMHDKSSPNSSFAHHMFAFVLAGAHASRRKAFVREPNAKLNFWLYPRINEVQKNIFIFIAYSCTCFEGCFMEIDVKLPNLSKTQEISKVCSLAMDPIQM